MKFVLTYDETNDWWHFEFWDGEYLLGPAFDFNGSLDGCLSWAKRLAEVAGEKS